MERFSCEANGYNREEVNAFISDVIKQTESIVSRAKSQELEIEQLRGKLNHYSEFDDYISSSFVKAEEWNEEIKRAYEKEGEIIIYDAKSNADRIINEALLRANQLEQNSILLENKMRVLKTKLDIVMRQHDIVMDEIKSNDDND